MSSFDYTCSMTLRKKAMAKVHINMYNIGSLTIRFTVIVYIKDRYVYQNVKNVLPITFH